MLEFAGVEVLVTRKTIPALKDSTEKIFTSLLPPEFEAQCDIRRAGGHLESISFPNGSVAYFRGMDDPVKHRSMTLAMIAYDELTEFTEDDYTQMLGRVRQVVPTKKAKALGAPRIPVNKIIAATNPNGKDWVYKWFVDPDNKQPDTAFFLSTSLENPFNPADYIRRLLAMPEQYVRRYVLATFDDFAGSIYPDWGYETHVIPPFEKFPANAQFMQLMDPGTHNPTAALWTYYDASQHCLVGIAEYKEAALGVTKHASAWRAIEARHKMRVGQRIADPQAINVRDRGTNMALSDQYRRLGFNFQLGPSRLEDRIPALGTLILMGRFKVTTDCPMTAEALQNYRWDDLTPAQIAKGVEAKPNKKDMDLVDCCQYAASRYIAPPKIVAGSGSGDEFTDWVWKTQRKQMQNAVRGPERNHDLGGVPL
jgi:PBSX family phage terminase large subunit